MLVKGLQTLQWEYTTLNTDSVVILACSTLFRNTTFTRHFSLRTVPMQPIAASHIARVLCYDTI